MAILALNGLKYSIIAETNLGCSETPFRKTYRIFHLIIVQFLQTKHY